MTVENFSTTGKVINTIIATIKGVILNPVETFRASRDDTADAVFAYLGVLLLFNAIMSAAIVALSFTVIPGLLMYSWIMTGYPLLAPVMGLGVPVAVFFSILFYWIILIILAGAWIHLWVYILGGRNGIMPTMKAFMYGMTPWLLFGWIPVIGIFFAVWSFLLDILGIRELAGLSTGRAARSMIVSLLIVVFVFVFYIIPAVGFR